MRGGGTLVAFEVEAEKRARFRFQDALKLVLISNIWRCQEPDHPSGDDDASAHSDPGARRARHQRRAGSVCHAGSSIPMTWWKTARALDQV